MKQKVRSLILILAPFLVSGCAGTPEVASELQPIKQNVFQLIDDRQDTGKKTRVERVGHNLVVYSLGDDRIRPAVPTMLEAYLHRAAGEKLQDRTISLVRADVRVYKMSGSHTPLAERIYYPPPGASPGAIVGGVLVADLLDMGFTEKRIEIEIEAKVGDRVIVASDYDYYTLASPEKKTLEMLANTFRKFAEQIN